MKDIPQLQLPKAKLTYSNPDDPPLKRLVINTIEFATGRRKLEKIYNKVRNAPLPPTALWGEALAQLNIEMHYDADQLKKIPKDVPLIFVANHPFGVVDGLMLAHLISTVRSRFALLVNEVLCKEPLLAPYLLPIDFNETKAALQTNLRTRTIAMERLSAGEALGIFPAGGVATAPKIWKQVQDLEWKRFTAKLIQQTQATVIPLYFHGSNSPLFQIVSQIHLNLRLGLLLHEIRNKIGKTIPINIGDPIPFETLKPYKDRQQLLDYLRKVTFNLANRSAFL